LQLATMPRTCRDDVHTGLRPWKSVIPAAASMATVRGQAARHSVPSLRRHARAGRPARRCAASGAPRLDLARALKVGQRVRPAAVAPLQDAHVEAYLGAFWTHLRGGACVELTDTPAGACQGALRQNGCAQRRQVTVAKSVHADTEGAGLPARARLAPRCAGAGWPCASGAGARLQRGAEEGLLGLPVPVAQAGARRVRRQQRARQRRRAARARWQALAAAQAPASACAAPSQWLATRG